MSIPPLPGGEYDVELLSFTDQRVLVRAKITLEYLDTIDGLDIQRWDAETIALAAFSEPGFVVQSCSADPFDETAGKWVVICKRGEITAVYTVDAYTGELTQSGEPEAQRD